MKRTHHERIWKYAIPIQDEFELEIHEPAIVVRAGLDPNGDPCVWAVVDPTQEKQLVRFRTYGTGTTFGPGKHTYIGTIHKAQYVWHVFQIKE